MNLLENLNPEQLEAVKHKDGPLLIIAGAGTGKTTVIAQRIAYLIEQGVIKPDEALALTFTEKAAGEMADRVGALLPYGYFDLWISTFHSFSERILKEHGLAIGLSTDFKLLNEFEQWALIKKNFDKFELDYYRPLGNPTKFIHALIKHFSRAKDEDISPAAYLEYAGELKENLDGMLGGNKTRSSCHSRGRRPSGIQESEAQTSQGNSQVLATASWIPAFAGMTKEKEGMTKEKEGMTKEKEGMTKEKEGMTDLNKEIAAQEASRINEVANAYHVYQQLLLDNNSLDFGDLINYCLKLFRERPAILEKYRRQFKYIMLDEFQDTNWSQYELIKILSQPKNNLAVVGDDDQSIFRFRGASMSNILQFVKDYPEAKKIILTKNYRSRQNILDLSYEFIKQNNPNRLEWQLNSPVILERSVSEAIGSYEKKRDAIAPLQHDNAQKLNKKLIAENQGAGEIDVIHRADLDEEVKAIVEKIVELLVPPGSAGAGKNQDKTVSLNDFAILVRANDSANVFMDELDRRGLPYIFGSRRGLYLKPVIMDTIAYFKLLDNYHESVSLWRILNLPIYNFTDSELIDFNHGAGKKACSLYEAINRADELKFSAETRKKITPLLALIAKHTALAREKNASEVFLAFLNDSGYLKYLIGRSDRENLEAMSLLNQFLKRIKNFEAASADKSIKSFLAELSLEMEAGEEGGLAADLEAGPEAVKILTVHAAKGLEFKYVFIANLVDKRFPTIERGEQISLPDALVKEILPEGDVHLEEERRLFYVAMTRAKFGLYFSWARDYGGARDKKPSRFLVELGLEKVDKTKVCHSRAGGNPEISSLGKTAVVMDPRVKPEDDKEKSRDGKINIMPAHFSYSQLAAYSNCPYQYRFAHILKIPVLGKEQFSFGKTMHATLQKLFILLKEKQGLAQGGLFEQSPLISLCHSRDLPCHSREGGNPDILSIGKTAMVMDRSSVLTSEQKKKTGCLREDDKEKSGNDKVNTLITFDEIIKIYEQSWIDDWYKDKKAKEDRKKQGREILKVFYEKYKNNWPETLYLEKGFNLKIACPESNRGADPSAKLPSTSLGTSGTGGEKFYIVRGVIDRIDRAPSINSPRPELGTKAGQEDGIKLVDYKTGRAKKKLTFAEKEQLFIYQLAAEELFKQPVKSLVFYYLDDNSEVEFIGAPEDLIKIKAKIISTIKEIGRGEFSPKPSQLCAWCDFKEICEFKA